MLTEASIETFTLLTAGELARGAVRYVGSTTKWHVFMRLETSSGPGMPFDHLSTYRVPVEAVTVSHGWTIRFSTATIEANDCPLLHHDPDPAQASVPGDPEVRERCGT